MSSISSTLNSISSSLLSEIESYLSTSKTSASTSASSSTSASDSSSTASDSLDLSQIAKLFKELNELKTSDPTEFKKVLDDAATALKNAAASTTDSTQASFLNDLASKFQNAAETGDLSQLEPPTAQSGSYGPPPPPPSDSGSSSTDSTSSSSSSSSSSAEANVQELLKTLLEAAQSDQSSGSTSSSTLKLLQDFLSSSQS